jgi:membrane protein DedA with SNARE-associated domain
MLLLGALISVSAGLGYALPAVIGLESLGVPSPGETALILAAVLASQGKLSIVIVIVIASASAIVGDNLGYAIGRAVGRDVLTAAGPLERRRRRAIAFGDRFYERHGSKAVLIGRWIALARVAVAWLAGINEMPFRVFFVWNAVGGITWATAIGLLGYYGGTGVEHLLSTVGVGAAVVLGVAIVAALVFVKVRERRAERSAAPE